MSSSTSDSNREDDNCLETNENIELGEDFEFEEASNDEIYSIDINKDSGLIIYGGKNQYSEVYDFNNEQIITKIDDFEDSILLAQFLPNSRFLIVTLNGTLALMEQDKEICVIQIEEDLTAAFYSKEYNRIVIGTNDGNVYLYDSELEHINTFGKTSSEIKSLYYDEYKIIGLREDQLCVWDEKGRIQFSLRANESYDFKYLPGGVVCFAHDMKIQIFKEKKKLFEIATEDVVESIEFVEKSLVIGGSFDYLLLIDTTGHYAIFKLNIKNHVLKIKRHSSHKIVFSTTADMIGLMDIRNIETLIYYDGGVGTIFDFSIDSNLIAVAGEQGYHIIDIDSSSGIGIADV